MMPLQALCQAVKRGRCTNEASAIACAKQLIDAGADVNAADFGDHTPLHYVRAMPYESQYVITASCHSLRALHCNAGEWLADVFIQSNHTPPQLASGRESASATIPFLHFLLKEGANAVAVDGQGWTPLHAAYNAMRESEAAVKAGEAQSSAPSEVLAILHGSVVAFTGFLDGFDAHKPRDTSNTMYVARLVVPLTVSRVPRAPIPL